MEVGLVYEPEEQGELELEPEQPEALTGYEELG